MAEGRTAKRTNPGKTAARARNAIVTGGASGIGLACVERLLAADWRVGLLGGDEVGLARARERFRSEPSVHVAALDVTDEDAATAVIGDMVAALGRLDGVVNSAGIGGDV